MTSQTTKKVHLKNKELEVKINDLTKKVIDKISQIKNQLHN